VAYAFRITGAEELSVIDYLSCQSPGRTRKDFAIGPHVLHLRRLGWHTAIEPDEVLERVTHAILVWLVCQSTLSSRAREILLLL
jgi:hypothetical protein